MTTHNDVGDSNTAQSQDSIVGKQGWLNKKDGKKSRWIACWFEAHTTCEIVSCYTDNPRLGPMRGSLIDFITLDGAKLKLEDNPKKSRFALSVREKSGGRHMILTYTKEERDEWKDMFEKVQTFHATAQTLIANAETPEQVRAKFLENDTSLLLNRPAIAHSLEGSEEFWDYNVQDLNGRNITLRDVVGSRLTLIMAIANFGSLLTRHAVLRILALKDELQDLGVQLIVMGAGPSDLAKQVFLKDQRLSEGVLVYCDQTHEICGVFARKFGKKEATAQVESPAKSATTNAPGTESGGVKSSLFGLYVVHRMGSLFEWMTNDLDAKPDYTSIAHAIKLFYMTYGAESWTHVTLPPRTWPMLKNSGDENEKMHKVDSKGYGYEFGTKNPPPGITSLIDNIYPYRDFFAPIEHVIFAIEDEDLGPMIIALDHTTTRGFNSKAVIIAKKGVTRTMVPVDQCASPKDMLRYICSRVLDKQLEKLKITQIEDKSAVEALVKLEAQIFFTQYKFGILFAKKGKIEEEEMYLNTESSPDFEQFLNWLGEKIKLSGWQKFRGGLDARGTDCTGSHSYFTEFCGQEVMFHVALLMPIKDNDPSRKRYIGNDVVVIVFKEGPDDKFDPQSMRSQFNHIFAVVEKVQTPTGPSYRIEIAQKPGVPPYPPFLPDPPLFPINPESRHFFLTKLINAERTAIAHASTFKTNMGVTREALLNDLIKNFTSKKPVRARPAAAAAASAAPAASAGAAGKPAEEEPTKSQTTSSTTTQTSTDDGEEPTAPEQADTDGENNGGDAEGGSVDYDKLEEILLQMVCKEKNIQFVNTKQAFEQLAGAFGFV